MTRWFAAADGKFPGYGREFGKCASRAACDRALIPGEPGYTLAPTVGDEIVKTGKQTVEKVKVTGEKPAKFGEEAP